VAGTNDREIFLPNNFLPSLHLGRWQETEKGDGAGGFFW